MDEFRMNTGEMIQGGEDTQGEGQNFENLVSDFENAYKTILQEWSFPEADVFRQKSERLQNDLLDVSETVKKVGGKLITQAEETIATSNRNVNNI